MGKLMHKAFLYTSIVALLAGCAVDAEEATDTNSIGEASSALASEDNSATATIKVGDTWGSGYCAVVKVSNTGTKSINDWEVGLNLKGAKITGSYNGVFATSGDTSTVTPVNHNFVMAPGASTEFGFCTSTTTPTKQAEVSSFKVAHPDDQPGPTPEIPAALSVYQDWGSGYCATVTVSNYTATATADWSVVIDMKGTTLGSSKWNAVFTTASGQVTAKAISPTNGKIAAKGTYAFGFCASATNSKRPAIISAQVGPKPVCGDGVLQAGEACDDGNTVDNDGCTNTCKLPVCGDGIIQADEACDDGNTVDNDGCTNTCKLPVCGDGIVQADEACDDGNTGECQDSCRMIS